MLVVLENKKLFSRTVTKQTLNVYLFPHKNLHIKALSDLSSFCLARFPCRWLFIPSMLLRRELWKCTSEMRSLNRHYFRQKNILLKNTNQYEGNPKYTGSVQRVPKAKKQEKRTHQCDHSFFGPDFVQELVTHLCLCLWIGNGYLYSCQC